MTVTDDVDAVLAISGAFKQRDVERMLELFAPDAVVVDHRWEEPLAVVGRDALRDFYRAMFEKTDALDEQIEILHREPGRIVARSIFWGRATPDLGSGEYNMEYILAIELEDGAIRRLETYLDVDSALGGLGR